MIVICKNTVKDITVKFGGLDQGVAFCQYGDLFLKIEKITVVKFQDTWDGKETKFNAINLRSGSLYSLKCDDEVSLVLAEVIWSLVKSKPNE